MPSTNRRFGDARGLPESLISSYIIGLLRKNACSLQVSKVRIHMIIKVRENEPFEAAMRRFKRAIEKTGLLTELRAREAYEKPTTERKRKHAAACKRHYKRIRSMQLPPKLY